MGVGRNAPHCQIFCGTAVQALIRSTLPRDKIHYEVSHTGLNLLTQMFLAKKSKWLKILQKASQKTASSVQCPKPSDVPFISFPNRNPNLHFGRTNRSSLFDGCPFRSHPFRDSLHFGQLTADTRGYCAIRPVPWPSSDAAVATAYCA